jgi:hypothetical protein
MYPLGQPLPIGSRYQLHAVAMVQWYAVAMVQWYRVPVGHALTQWHRVQWARVAVLTRWVALGGRGAWVGGGAPEPAASVVKGDRKSVV